MARLNKILDAKFENWFVEHARFLVNRDKYDGQFVQIVVADEGVTGERDKDV